MNRFFPSKGHQYQEYNINEDNVEDKPVNEKVTDIIQEETKNEENKETIEKMIRLVPVNADNINNKVELPIKQEIMEETVTATEVPEEVANENTNLNLETASKMPIIEIPINAEPINRIEDLNINKSLKDEPHADSEVASSYYHSKIYYVGF